MENINFIGTHTGKNLIRAMQGEALAYAKYQVYASLIGKTSKELEERINLIAHNEKEHFKVWAKLLLGCQYYNDEDNILDAISGEIHECESMYPEFARIAREEGFEDIAEKFEMISEIECRHSNEFESILDEMHNNAKRGSYMCINCGYVHYDDELPNECPVCDHPQNFLKTI